MHIVWFYIPRITAIAAWFIASDFVKKQKRHSINATASRIETQGLRQILWKVWQNDVRLWINSKQTLPEKKNSLH